MRIARSLGDGDVEQTALFELGGEDVFGVDDGVAAVAGLGARGGEVGLGLGGHDDGVAAGADDLVFERPQVLEVGEAKGTPVAAVVWMGGRVCKRVVVSGILGVAWKEMRKGGEEDEWGGGIRTNYE